MGNNTEIPTAHLRIEETQFMIFQNFMFLEPQLWDKLKSTVWHIITYFMAVFPVPGFFVLSASRSVVNLPQPEGGVSPDRWTLFFQMSLGVSG